MRSTRVLFLSLSLFCLSLGVSPAQLSAQEVIFQSNFESEEGLVVLKESDDNEFEFDYDYEDFDGIPEAPSFGLVGGAAQTGLKLESNFSAGVATAIAVATDGLELTGSYAVQVDAWLNYNFPAGTAGTTEFGGLSVGHDGETGGLDGASFIYDTDGDSGSDYRMYKSTDLQTVDTEQYSVPTLNNSDTVDADSGDIIIDSPFDDAFPSVDLEVAVPKQFIVGETKDGAGGFRWMTIGAVVDPSGAGTATFSITDSVSENTIEIGTIDNSIGDPVNLTGEVAVVFTDIFSSVSADSSLSFGIFDNLIVSTVAATSDPLDCDGDGSVTPADLSCATADTISATLTAANILAGDLDLDGSVGFPDFLILSENFGDDTKGGVYSQGDIDLDGAVGFPDFLALSQNFGATSAAASAVPEPSGSLLLGIACFGLIALRRTRRDA